MKTEIMQVTPSMARKWLIGNTRNRPLRPLHVQRLKESFERGEYVMTHQGIAFCNDGTIADGQHRLSAIALLPEHSSFPMLVTHGLSHEAAFPVIDVVMATRSVGDVLGVDRKVAEVGMFLCRLHEGRTTGVTPMLVRPFIELTATTTKEILDFCGSASKTWSSAPVRAAAVVCMMRGLDADYVKLMYRSLATADFDVMTPVIRALFKSHLSGKVSATTANDLFVRCLQGFDPSRANNTKVQIKDLAPTMSLIREWLSVQLFRQIAPKQAEAKRRARGVNL
jgi:hypothetical protein